MIKTTMFTKVSSTIAASALLVSLVTTSAFAATFKDGVKSFDEGNFKKAYEIWGPLADEGDKAAQYNLGVLYENGYGVKKSDYKAFQWYRVAATAGHVNAQFNLGVMYANGKGIRQNEERAQYWFQKAADQGDKEAKAILETKYTKVSVPANEPLVAATATPIVPIEPTTLPDVEATKDVAVIKQPAQQVQQAQPEAPKVVAPTQKVAEVKKEQTAPVSTSVTSAPAITTVSPVFTESEAAKWYRKAAEQGDARAQFNLGMLYMSGKGVTKNETQAVGLFRLAAAQGHTEALYNLAMCYANGQGVAQNDSVAVRYLQQSATLGHAEAQYNLGMFYLAGRSLAQDDNAAFKYFKLAADQGHAEAQFNVAKMYEAGRATKQDDKYALYWFTRAAQQGHARAQFQVGQLLSSEKN